MKRLRPLPGLPKNPCLPYGPPRAVVPQASRRAAPSAAAGQRPPPPRAEASATPQHRPFPTSRGRERPLRTQREKGPGPLPRDARGSAQAAPLPPGPPAATPRKAHGRPFPAPSLTLKGLLRSGSAKGLLSKSDMAGAAGPCAHRAAALPLAAPPTLAGCPPPPPAHPSLLL